MTWSYTGYRQFQKCSRQWYYSNIVAHTAATESFRKEVTILSKLKTLDAWRGDIVDYIISRVIVSKIRKGSDLSEDRLLWVADKVFDEQLAYASGRVYRTTETKLDDFGKISAIIDLDFKRLIPESEITRVRRDVHLALKNFLSREEMIDRLRDAKQLITQRRFQQPFQRFKIKGTPDLIAIYEDEPPHIFDWKVHTFATKAYDDQLMCYAILLNNTKHKDFPDTLKNYTVFDYKLTEFQLLLNEFRDYTMSQDDLDFTISSISGDLLRMYRAGADKTYLQTTPSDFPMTLDVSNCSTCPFTQICKQHENEIRNKHFSN